MSANLTVEELTLVEAQVANEKKNIILAYILWFFLGCFGGHNFYVGRVKLAVIELLLFLGGILLTFLIIGYALLIAWAVLLIIDLFKIPEAIQKDLDRKREIAKSSIESQKRLATN